MKDLSKSLIHYFNCFIYFAILSFKSSLDILDACPLSNVCFANIFFQPMAYLFILLTVSFEGQKF